eukprot:TRINITY_DN1436_c1_g1_i2.p1 TRINITY_DN1436_c1_g1~~TRINITY_DN1436_c1_g1_i2.p1  ORF type:complete len:194 (+),score=63.58 TRINITY_DN1436_c1_g1_i2:59-640(+)
MAELHDTMHEEPKTDDALDEEIEEMRIKVLEMEEKLKGQQTELAEGAKEEEGEGGDDTASIYIGQVDYHCTPDELATHFAECGTVKRVTILCDKLSGHPKGYAYMEFEDPASVDKAVILHDSLLKGRKIKVSPKRTNYPGVTMMKGKGKGKGAFKGYKGWWDMSMYSSAFSPYAAGGKGKGKGKKGWRSLIMG